MRRRSMRVLLLALVLWSAACATLPAPRTAEDGKVYAAREEQTHPLVVAIGNGAMVGGFLGMTVTVAMCAWDGLVNGSTGTDPWGDDEDEGCGIPFTAFVGPPLIGAAGGAVVGLFAGLLIWAFEGVPEPADSTVVAP